MISKMFQNDIGENMEKKYIVKHYFFKMCVICSKAQKLIKLRNFPQHPDNHIQL